jgi:hypothetical protein
VFHIWLFLFPLSPTSLTSPISIENTSAKALIHRYRSYPQVVPPTCPLPYDVPPVGSVSHIIYAWYDYRTGKDHNSKGNHWHQASHDITWLGGYPPGGDGSQVVVEAATVA